eukprot:gene5216-5747_t
MDKSKEEFQHDWYGILGCEPGTSKELIEKAARKLSAKHHPDKTSDPEAPAKFLLIQKAKDILTDDSKKKVIDDYYTQSKKRKDYEESRWRGMDDQRKRFRQQLDSRLQQEQERRHHHHHHQQQGKAVSDPEEVLRHELRKQTKVMEQMRRENDSLRERLAQEEAEEERRAAKQAAAAAATASSSSSSYPTASSGSSEEQRVRQIKFKWKRSGESQSEDSLYFLLKRFGTIEQVSLHASKGTSAVITFDCEAAARQAVDYFESSTDFQVSWMGEGGREKRAKVFSHQYTSSAGLNEQIQKEIERVKQMEALKAAARGPTGVGGGGGRGEDVSGPNGSIDVAKLLAKENRILSLMRKFGGDGVGGGGGLGVDCR